MGIFKLTKGELKKIFLKPGIFVVTALLVLVLAISMLMFNVNERDDMIANIRGETISQMYAASFGASSENNSYSKTYLNNRYIISSNNIIDFYLNELEKEENSKKSELNNKLSEVKSNFSSFKGSINSNSSTDAQRDLLKQDLTEFNSMFLSTINGTNGFNYLLISSNNKADYDLFMSIVFTQPFIETNTHLATVNKIEEIDTFNKLTNYIDDLRVYKPSQNAVEKCQSNLQKAQDNLLLIESEIEELKDNFPSDKTLEKKNKFKTLVTRYQQASINIHNLTLHTLNLSAISDFDDTTIQNLYAFSSEDYKTKYSINEQKNICQFYLDNNKYAFEYASPLDLNMSSNLETNAYDFMYFALELCSFIIIIYVVYLGATMIAGEYASGTMKLLAIRPYSRGKILFSKLLSTILIGITFLLISFVITFIMGGILFGLDSLSMILVFNSNLVTATSPFVVILLLFICKMVEIIFYAILALSISTLFKSHAGSIVIAMLIYFISFVLTMFTSSLGIFKYIPFVNTNLFGYFGSHTISQSGNLFANMFSKVIANDMNFYTSFIIICLFSAILYTVTLVVFKKRDIK